MRKKSNNQLIRLNKVLSKSGFGSRKEADKLIKIGAVKINDKIINKLGGKVSTKVSKEKNYCKAEGYHQKYEQKKSLKFD